jgi:hypothetical protein
MSSSRLAQRRHEPTRGRLRHPLRACKRANRSYRRSVSLKGEPLEELILLAATCTTDPLAAAFQDRCAAYTGVAPDEQSDLKLGFDGDTSRLSGEDTLPLADATPTGESYLVYEHWGGTWHDAEKSPSNSEDDLMCWAAAASNILAWSGWGLVEGMATADAMFAYFQDHWTDQTGIMQAGWDWWFDGTNPTQGWSGWSQVDVPGGGFHLSESLYGYFQKPVPGRAEHRQLSPRRLRR